MEKYSGLASAVAGVALCFSVTNAMSATLPCGVAQAQACGASPQTWEVELTEPAFVLMGFIGTGGGAPGTAQLYESDCATPVSGVLLPAGGDVDGEVLDAGTYCLSIPCTDPGAGYLLETVWFGADGPLCDSSELVCDADVANGALNGASSMPAEMFDTFSFVAMPGETIDLTLEDTGGAGFTPCADVTSSEGWQFVANGAGTHSVALPGPPGGPKSYGILLRNCEGPSSTNLATPGTYRIGVSGCSVNEPGFVYFTGGTLNTIMRAEAPCFAPQVIVGPADAEAYGAIVVDTLNSKLYFGVGGDALVHGIRRSNLDGSGVETIATYASNITIGGIALDAADNRLCWNASGAGATTIWCSNLDGSGAVQAVTGQTVGHVEIDPLANKLYWSDGDNLRLMRSNMNGSNVETVATGLCSPRGFALDAANNVIYVANENLNGPCFARIQKVGFTGAGFSGSASTEDVFDTGIGFPEDIALDPAGSRLYWSGFYQQSIFSGDVAGTGVAEIRRALGGHVRFLDIAPPIGEGVETCDCMNCNDGADNDGDGAGDFADSACPAATPCPGSACGDGIVDPDEVCDDGNTADGDCCDALCLSEFACDDGNPCTQDRCESGSGCVFVPAPRPTLESGGTCRAADRTAVLIRQKNDGTVLLKWRWLEGDATPIDAFGSPGTTTKYTLCVYDTVAGEYYIPTHASPAPDNWVSVASGSDWILSGPTLGWKYKKRVCDEEGVDVMRLVPDTTRPGELSLRQKGECSSSPIPCADPAADHSCSGRFFHLDPYVVVQLLNDDTSFDPNGECWDSSFVTMQKNTPTLFKTQRKLRVPRPQ